MMSPILEEIPSPPPNKIGWPWTEESPKLSKTMLNNSPWPKISIVTPSYNQGKFLEETIRSILLQGYPNLEYIIIDGGSIDESVEIIKKYEKWLAFWISEKDRGQSHAINKGFAKASGDIYAYINSDDLYCPGALSSIAPIFKKNGDPHLVAGECVIFEGTKVKRIFTPWWPERLSYFVEKTYSSTFAQPASFWSKEIYEDLGGFDQSLNFCFDREFFLRIGLAGVNPYLIDRKVARFREHSESKTILQGIRFHEESISIIKRHAKDCGISNRKKKKIIAKTTVEIFYIDVFRKWKDKGRLSALLRYFQMIIRYPVSLLDRKILGQFRRIVTFRASNVDDLNKI
ncbi:MAG: glycosyltransferase family 2 protein [Thermodesulfobacteriota bacterium]|nr:glycosyltransferase family 2 protein [Thermodesulfobacteriota bacterium]